MDLVKAEILFSRKCNLRCGHCGMVNNEPNSISIEEWKKGFDNLKALNCGFAAFYGAEPMLEFDKLKVVLPYAESIGIPTTIITSGKGIPNFIEKLDELYKLGGKSLSMSYDPIGYDSYSKMKSEMALTYLKYWASLPNIRDAAAIVTLTSSNYHLLPLTVEFFSNYGIWTFFDIIHQTRNMPGEKCKDYAGKLLFKERHKEPFVKMLSILESMKKNGALIHNDPIFFHLVKENLSKGDLYNWCCADYKVFPSWLTIDCDGTVLPCDDFHVTRDFKFYKELTSWWPKCKKVFKAEILKHGCKCCWNTHIGAHSIKGGLLTMGDYVHGNNS